MSNNDDATGLGQGSLELRSGLSRQLWRLGLLNGLLFFVLIGLAIGALYVRDRDLNGQIEANRQQIEYLCETASVMDLLVVQEKASLELELKTAKLGPNQRELLRGRVASLAVFHRELSDQRACREVQ